MNPLFIRGCIVIATAAFALLLTKLTKGRSDKIATSDKGATVEPVTETNSSGGTGGGAGDTDHPASASADLTAPTAQQET